MDPCSGKTGLFGANLPLDRLDRVTLWLASGQMRRQDGAMGLPQSCAHRAVTGTAPASTVCPLASCPVDLSRNSLPSRPRLRLLS